MKKLLVFAPLFVALFGCASRYQLAESFDAYAADQMLAAGNNEIHGSALIRQNGGGIVTCAGTPVYLMPDTPRAREWAVTVYGYPDGGYRSVSERGVVFDEGDPLFQHMRTGTCNTQGNFSFPNLKDGSYFVSTRIVWNAGYSLQGGTLMQRVTVEGGKSVEAVLSPR